MGALSEANSVSRRIWTHTLCRKWPSFNILQLKLARQHFHIFAPPKHFKTHPELRVEVVWAFQHWLPLLLRGAIYNKITSLSPPQF